ncbi:hypothetical protein [Gemmatimonas sp.]|uniref:hypothetical protein n=1 Tax=Gemmatimonas sp. TaxID=1962908 RepID=UPI0025B86197|nr:hypothetical protein [Gemmatimonas sp.]MCA2990998.1 hypothetical protein [Gemmatimonas sp.]
MKPFILRAALPAALLLGTTQLQAQSETTRKPVVRDSAAGTLDTDPKVQFGWLMAALDEAISRRERELTSMRNTLQNSVVLRDLLTTREIPMTQVIAVDVAADGKMAMVFYRPA